jgi:predicted dehydrogenase
VGNPGFGLDRRILRQLLEAKAIGKIKSVYTDYGEYFTRDHRIFDPKLAGGPLLDLGTYPVSLLTENFWRFRTRCRLWAAGFQWRQRPAFSNPDGCGGKPGNRLDDPLWLHANQCGDGRDRRSRPI